MLSEQKIRERFLKYFPEYSVKTESAEKAYHIFKTGLLSKEGSGNALFLVSEEEKKDPIGNIIEYLNKARKEMTGNSSLRGFKKTDAVLRLIKARMKDGYEEADFLIVIDHKCKEWKGTNFQKYIQPSTLFSASHFPEYLVDAESKKKVYKSEVDQQISELMG